MNMQEQRFLDTRGFRIAVIAVAAVAVLALAAYWFGTGLRADTSASVAPSPLGSSLSVVPASRSEDYVGRLINSAAASRAASLAALAQSRSDFHADLNNASAASRAASPGASRFEDRYDRMNSSSAADPYQNSWMGFTAPESVEVTPPAADPANPSRWNLITPNAPS